MNADWRTEADRLRAEGLSIRQIAARVGVSKSMVGVHLKPRYCACGNRRCRLSARCDDCCRAARRAEHEARVALVARMYNDGSSLLEIGEALGRGRYHGAAAMLIREARQSGRIGYRRNGYGAAA